MVPEIVFLLEEPNYPYFGIWRELKRDYNNGQANKGLRQVNIFQSIISFGGETALWICQINGSMYWLHWKFVCIMMYQDQLTAGFAPPISYEEHFNNSVNADCSVTLSHADWVCSLPRL